MCVRTSWCIKCLDTVYVQFIPTVSTYSTVCIPRRVHTLCYISTMEMMSDENNTEWIIIKLEILDQISHKYLLSKCPFPRLLRYNFTYYAS